MSVFSRKARATDMDRAITCTTLDNAYAEGQLDTTEHGNRIAAAMKAKTLGELDQLTSDIQRGNPALYPTVGAAPSYPAPGHPAPSYPASGYPPPNYGAVASPSFQSGYQQMPHRSSGGNALGMLAIVGIIVLVLAGLGGLLLFRASDGDSGSTGSGGPGNGGIFGNVIAPTDLLTADGFNSLISNARDRFGDTKFDEVVIYPEYAIFTRPVPGEPNRALRYTWRGGFDEGSPTPRMSDEPPVDLAQVNVDAAVALMTGAPQTLNVRDVTSRYFIIGGAFGPLRCYVSNEFSESGYLAAGLDGTVHSVYPNE